MSGSGLDLGSVERVTFVPFMPDGRVALIQSESGEPSLPEGELLSGEDVALDAALRIPLATAGFRMQHFHPLAIEDRRLFAWIEGDRYAGSRPHKKADLLVVDTAHAVRSLEQAGKQREAELVGRAHESRQLMSENEYLEESIRLLEAAYLRATTPQGGSGFGGSSEEWRLSRQHIVQGIDRDGTFLDIGCANGYLMECVVAWAAERGYAIEPHGLELAPHLVELARARLPEWADRIWQGSAIEWSHLDEVRFDFVHALLDFVRPNRRAEMIRHLRDAVVAPGGRLLVSHYIDPTVSSDPRASVILQSLGFEVSGESVPEHPRQAPTAWIDGWERIVRAH